MKTIAIMIQKGGTGKTTTVSALASGLNSAALASGLNSTGKTVLLVDLDPQQNLSFAEGVDLISIPCTLYDVWKGKQAIDQAVQTIRPGRDIITGGLQLASADFEFSGAVGREQLLKRSLDQIAGQYDYCLIDCPPSLGLLSMNACTACNSILIPMCVDALSIQGLTQLWDFIRNIKTYCNPDLTVCGILLTQYDDRTLTTKALESQIIQSAQQAGTKVFTTRIHRSQAIRTAQAQRAIDIYDSTAVRAAVDYRSLTQEIITALESEG